MKKLLLIATVLGFSTVLFAQNAAPKAENVIKFKEMKHNFGKIKQGVPVTYDFEFTNISESPAIIENATASCGCTTPQWPQQPVMKGKSDKIKAGFNAAAPGVFEKGIFVKLKGIDYPVEIKITGEVLTPEAYAKYESEKKSKTGSK
ncbi:MAG: DUF1573 domain-containing protein [Chitinophagaceae bacterium]|jgi:hypothetical protein|nr:DUF1573 domain-containing protein [Chitinophagaceae bacterium]